MFVSTEIKFVRRLIPNTLFLWYIGSTWLGSLPSQPTFHITFLQEQSLVFALVPVLYKRADPFAMMGCSSSEIIFKGAEWREGFEPKWHARIRVLGGCWIKNPSGEAEVQPQGDQERIQSPKNQGKVQGSAQRCQKKLGWHRDVTCANTHFQCIFSASCLPGLLPSMRYKAP